MGNGLLLTSTEQGGSENWDDEVSVADNAVSGTD